LGGYKSIRPKGSETRQGKRKEQKNRKTGGESISNTNREYDTDQRNGSGKKRSLLAGVTTCNEKEKEREIKKVKVSDYQFVINDFNVIPSVKRKTGGEGYSAQSRLLANAEHKRRGPATTMESLRVGRSGLIGQKGGLAGLNEGKFNKRRAL